MSHPLRSRRSFLRLLALSGLAPISRGASAQAGSPSGSGGSGSSTSAIPNRSPLRRGVMIPWPLGSIHPAGWLKQQLRIQADGLGGHLDETWPDVGPNSGWLGGTGESWERGPYFLDGLVPLAYLLDDPRLKAKAQRFLDWTLDNPWENGMIGPRSNDDWWPRMVMLKALTQYHDASSDPRVIPLLSRYFAYQASALPARPLRDWGKYRWQDEALTVFWLYNRTGDRNLLDLARLLREQGYDWRAEFDDFHYTRRTTPEAIGLVLHGPITDAAMQSHGVNIAMGIKEAALWSLLSGSEEDSQGATQALAVLDRFHGLPNGMFSADEHLAGRDPSQGTELCTVVETMFSLEQALAVTGDPLLADRLERIAFNALPGAFTDDMWAHQYNQEPNQIEVSLHKKPWTTDGPESNLYGLEPNYGCCTANFHQGWPKFAASLFMLSSDDGLAAVAYAPCSVTTTVRGVQVQGVMATDYPFRGSVRLILRPATPVAFPLRLRIPSWANGAHLRVNGEAGRFPAPGAFARIERTWIAGDLVELEFPLPVRASRWYRDSLAVERGALVFSYSIGEDWLKLRTRGMTADWQVYPTSPWNYGLELNPDSGPDAAATSISVSESPVAEFPFALRGAPVKLQAKARKLPAWEGEDGAADPLPQSPAVSDRPQETIALVPYAAAKLRITAFPQIKPT